MTGPGGSEGDRWRAEVIAREQALLDPQVRSSREALDVLLHPRFREIGASGRHWSRDELIDELVTGEHAAAAQMEDVTAELVAEGVVLLTYRTHGAAGPSSRSSVWTLTGDGWRVYFHQGTARSSCETVLSVGRSRPDGQPAQGEGGEPDEGGRGPDTAQAGHEPVGVGGAAGEGAVDGDGESREGATEALASVRAEGLEPTLDGLEVLEAIASGRIDEDDGNAALRARHQQ